MKYFIIFFSFALIVISSCVKDDVNFDQFPLEPGGVPVIIDVTYVQQSPTWNQFNGQTAVLLGREPLVYVADTKNNKIDQIDLSGVLQGTLPIKSPRAIAQDYNYDLLVIGDSVLNFGTFDTISVLYRIQLVPVGGLLSNASLIPLLGSNYPTPLTSNNRRFTGVAVYPNNTYIVTRTGPDNTSSLDPDNALLDIVGITTVTSVTPLSGFQPTGNGVYSIDMMSAITTFTGNMTDFIITRNSPTPGFKVLWFVYDNVKGTYNPKFIPEDNVDILNVPLETPDAICLDNNNNIYVVDNTLDSLYKFGSDGKLKVESFGGTGSGTNQLNSPGGVSFFDKVLYISDTGNNRIVRYKLSTDLY